MVVRAGQEDSAGRGVACDSGLALNTSGVRDVDLDELARRAGDARIRGDCECARDGGSQQPPESADPSHQTSPLTCGTTPAPLSGLPRSVSWPRATSTEDRLRLVPSALSFSSSALRRLLNRSRPSRSRIQRPRPRHALELALGPLLEVDPRAGYEIPDGGRDEYLARGGRAGHSSTDRHRDPRDLALVELALARVHPCAHLEAEAAHAFDNCLCATDRPRRPVEGCEEAVTRGVLLLASESRELAAHQRVMAVEEMVAA